MTLLTRRVTYYFRCLTDPKNHRFQRTKPDKLRWCPICGGVIQLHGLADSTRYADDPDDAEATGVSSQEKDDRRP